MILSKPYKNILLKKIGEQLKTARELIGMDIERAAYLAHQNMDFFVGIEAGDAGSYQKLRVEEMLILFAQYGKEMVVSSRELPQEERYHNLRYYSQAELQKFLQKDQKITY